MQSQPLPALPLAFLLLAFAVTIGFALVSLSARIARKISFRCTCGYDPTGLGPHRCPECGRSLAPERLVESALDGLKGKVAALTIVAMIVLIPLLTGLSAVLRIASETEGISRMPRVLTAAAVFAGPTLWLAALMIFVTGARRIVRTTRARLYAAARSRQTIAI